MPSENTFAVIVTQRHSELKKTLARLSLSFLQYQLCLQVVVGDSSAVRDVFTVTPDFEVLIALAVFKNEV